MFGFSSSWKYRWHHCSTEGCRIKKKKKKKEQLHSVLDSGVIVQFLAEFLVDQYWK